MCLFLVTFQDNRSGNFRLERIQRFRAEKGDISELELLRIQVQRFAFERDAADARHAVSAAKIALRTVAGPDRIAEDFDVVGDLAYRDVSYRPSDLYRRVMQNRPDIRAEEAAREKARADASMADATRQAVAIQALSEVDTALSSLRTEADKVKALRDTYLPKARQARDTVEFAYRRGGVNLLDFLDAQRTYRETSIEYLRALGNYQAAVYQLEAAVGGSLEN